MTVKIKSDAELKIDRWKDKAELFLENDIKCFIKTADSVFYSGDVVFIGDNWLVIDDIVKKEKCRIFWLDVILFEEYKKKEVGK
jgi:hypothetical protein